MRKTQATWRLSFCSAPSKEQLDQVKELLAPIERVELPPDYGVIFREIGLSDHLMIEPEEELTAGEVALNCLLKAHRLGTGWSIMWPGFPKTSKEGWSGDHIQRAAMPECLDGLTGGFSDSQFGGKSLIPKLQSASFSVSLVPERAAAPKPSAPEIAPPMTQSRRPNVESTEFNVYVRPALDITLAMNRIYPWSWTPSEARTLLERRGYQFIEELDDELVFTGRDKVLARLRIQGGVVLWVEFVVRSFPNPHLLDEIEFTRKQEEYEMLFHNSVNHLETTCGPPEFVGASGEAGFPQDQWADWAAVWTLGEYTILIEQKHNDKELPLELSLVIMPAAGRKNR